jgi:hypothetical protein
MPKLHRTGIGYSGFIRHSARWRVSDIVWVQQTDEKDGSGSCRRSNPPRIQATSSSRPMPRGGSPGRPSFASASIWKVARTAVALSGRVKRMTHNSSKRCRTLPWLPRRCPRSLRSFRRPSLSRRHRSGASVMFRSPPRSRASRQPADVGWAPVIGLRISRKLRAMAGRPICSGRRNAPEFRNTRTVGLSSSVSCRESSWKIGPIEREISSRWQAARTMKSWSAMGPAPASSRTMDRFASAEWPSLLKNYLIFEA